MPTLPPQGYVVIALAGLVSLLGAYAYGRHDGAKLNESAWQKREAETNAKVAQEILDNAERVRTEEHVKADKQNQIAINLHDQLKASADAKDHTIADLRNRTQRLSILAQCPASGELRVPKAASGTAGADAGVRVFIPDAIAEALTALASRCDLITDIARARKAVILNDRK